MKQVLLYGEGPTDYGMEAYSTGKWLDGPVQSFMRKICPDIEIKCVASLKDDRPKVQRKTLQSLHGHAPEALFLSLKAKEMGKDIAALYIDGDRTPGCRPTKELDCKKRHRELKEQILEGFQSSRCTLSCLPIIPMKMIESWLMSDPQSFPKAFGGETPLEMPAHPELEWGEKNSPSSNYPKNQLLRILAQYHQGASRENFVALAENSDIQMLRQKCPISFEDFYIRLKEITERADTK